MRIMAVPCGVFRKCKWGTQGNGKLTAFASGRPAFREHAKRAEGSDSAPRLAHAESSEHRAYKPQFRQKRKRSRSPAGPRRLGTAMRISASLSRRLSAFFGSTPSQDPKAAKFAVLIPGPGIFVNVQLVSRVMIPPPIRNAPCFAVCALVCDLSLKAECVPTFARKSKDGPFVREAEKHDER